MAGTGKAQGLLLQALIVAQGGDGGRWFPCNRCSALAGAARFSCERSYNSRMQAVGMKLCFIHMQMVLRLPSAQEPRDAEECLLTSMDSDDDPMTRRAVSFETKAERVRDLRLKMMKLTGKDPLKSIPI